MIFKRLKIFLLLATILISSAVSGFPATLQFVDTFNFTDGDSGYVQKSGLNYTVGYGWINCKISKNPLTGVDQRAVSGFDTSPLPDNATITKAEFYNIFAIIQPDNPTTASKTLLGSWCGSTLDASANDWTASGATDLSIQMHAQSGSTWIDLSSGGVNPAGDINLTGVTDLMIVDTSVPLVTTGTNWNQSKSKCQLRITYTVPVHSLPATGVGN